MAFSFATHDLCQWVSGEDVSGLVAAEFPWEGTAHRTVRPSGASCALRLTTTSGDVGEVAAADATSWKDFDGAAYDFSRVDIVAFDDEVRSVDIGAAVSGHPSLSVGVAVHNGGFGQFALWVPPVDEYLALTVTFGGGWWDEVYVERFLGVADQFVREPGWLPTT